MKRQGSTRALHFAVTGALLGSGLTGVGCKTIIETPPTNTGPMNEPQPDDGAAPDHVNEGPVDEPSTEETHTNPGPQAEPEAEPEPTNMRKVEDGLAVRPEPTPKYVNTVRVEDASPPASKK